MTCVMSGSPTVIRHSHLFTRRRRDLVNITRRVFLLFHMLCVGGLCGIRFVTLSLSL
jgi:hypothetical protein